MEPPNIFSRVFNFFNGPSACDYSHKSESNSKMVKANFHEKTPSIATNSYSAKTKKLQDSHRLSPKEESWFNIKPQQFIPECPPSFYPPASSKSFHSSKSPLPSSHQQPIFNLNRGRFETLPVSIASQEYNPPMMSLDQCQHYHPSQEEEMLSLPGTMDNFCNELVDIVEFTLVESVCHRSRLEYNHQNRLAAEILAASTLNPNAKEFTPKTAVEEDRTMGQLDGHIELTDSHNNDDEICRPSVATIVEKDESEDKDDNSSCDNTDNDTDDDDWDWDSDEDCATVECVDLQEFEDLFQVNLLVTNLQPKPAMSKLCAKLQEVNRQFSKLYPSNLCQDKTGPCLVSFSDHPVIILEPESLAEDLQEARKSDFKQRQADRERMERLIAPILTTQHRNNMYRRIYGESAL